MEQAVAVTVLDEVAGLVMQYLYLQVIVIILVMVIVVVTACLDLAKPPTP